MSGFSRERLARKSDVAAEAAELEVPVVIAEADLPAAFTQTFSTASRTVAAATAAVLTVSDGAGTNDNTIGAITDNASTIAAVQELADEVNKLVADNAVLRGLINAIIDDHQALGFCDS